jgi:cyclic pyranopterin phosphate synthase
MMKNGNGALTHLDERGRARMVDVGGKAETAREAVARCRVLMAPGTRERLLAGGLPKGDALAVARVAGILAAKKTPELIPLCHPLALSSVEVGFSAADGPGSAGRGPGTASAAVEVEARVTLTGRTGAEMEALTACAVAALTLYDMVKAVDRDVVIDSLRLVRKAGGKSGTWERPGERLGAFEGPEIGERE